MEEEIIEVPRWVLDNIHEALREVVKSYHCEERTSCLKRNVMLAFNMTSQLIKDGKYEYEQEHYMKRGQMPD